jgi:hypothetical protein
MSTITAEVVDTGEKRDARGRRVTPGARRRQLVQAYRGGGLTMADFARREGSAQPVELRDRGRADSRHRGGVARPGRRAA